MLSPIIGTAMLLSVGACDNDGAVNGNRFGLVYAGAITENISGAVNIHPVIYDMNGIQIAANVYTPAGYDDSKKYPAIVVAHPNGGVKEQVAGLYASAVDAAVDKIGPSVLVTHSAGGMPGWMAAMENENVRGIVAYEPGGFVFPDDDVPAPIDGLTGGASDVPVPRAEFMKLTQIPIVMYFGDYIPETPSQNLGDENWRVRLQMARNFADVINKNGGNATLVELPKIGIHGNTHFLMQDLNNKQLADLLDEWLRENNLAR